MIIITYFSIDLCIWKCTFVCVYIDDDEDGDGGIWDEDCDDGEE